MTNCFSPNLFGSVWYSSEILWDGMGTLKECSSSMVCEEVALKDEGNSTFWKEIFNNTALHNDNQDRKKAFLDICN